MSRARPVAGFAVDAAFDVPGYVPGWLQRRGAPASVAVPGPPLPRTATSVLATDAMAHIDAVVEQYGRILAAAAPARQRDAEVRRWMCFEVDVLLTLPGEWPVRVEMFGDAATGAQMWLAEVGDVHREPGELYDNLDQGWALRIVSTADAVYTMEWDPDKEAPDVYDRALRFHRTALAEQAIYAEARLRAVHAELVRRLGEDLWNRSG